MEQFVYTNITDNRSIPFNVAGTGTITTFGKAIVGVGTKFMKEMPAGSYLVNLSTWQAYRVYRTDSDTLAFLEKVFTSNISPGSTPQIIHANLAKVKSITLNTSDSIKVQNANFTGAMTITKSGNSGSDRADLIEPIIIDATGHTVEVSILNF